MSLFALQSLAGGFLDEDGEHFNKKFDDWCLQFDSYDEALMILETLEDNERIDIVEITPLSYPKYFFNDLQGTIHTTRQIGDKIVCIVEPQMGANFRLAICDLKTKKVRLTKTSYKSIPNVESAFANIDEE